MAVTIPIERRLSALESQIASLQQEVADNTTKKIELESFKRLLFVHSFELEDLISKCLTELGANIKPAK